MSEIKPIAFTTGDLILNRFRVLRKILGGRGIVYLCRDEDHRVNCAIKTLIPRRQDKWEMDVFFADLEGWVELEIHSNIVGVLAVEYVYDVPYVVMEWVPDSCEKGCSLQNWIDCGYRFPSGEILDFALQFCDGMVHCAQTYGAMGQRFVHGDIKPSNILITPQKLLKISDFGFSGYTIGYASPERLSDLETDERSDIYSFGMVMAELLALTKVDGDRREIRDLTDILRPCVHPDKEARPLSFAEMREKLCALHVRVHGQAHSPRQDTAHYKQYMMMKAGNLARLKKYDRALRILETLLNGLGDVRSIEDLDVEGNFTRLMYNYATVNAEMGNTQTAIQCYSFVNSVNPSHSRAWANKGVLLRENDLDDDALACFEIAFSLDPDDMISLTNIVEIIIKKNDARKGDELLARLGEKANEARFAQYGKTIGSLLYYRQEFDKAALHLAEYLVGHSYDWESAYYCAISLFQSRQVNRSRHYFKKAIDVILSHINFHEYPAEIIALISSFYKTHDLDNAIKYLKLLKRDFGHREEVQQFDSLLNLEYQLKAFCAQEVEEIMRLFYSWSNRSNARFAEVIKRIDAVFNNIGEMDSMCYTVTGLLYLSMTLYSVKGAAHIEMNDFPAAIEAYDRLLDLCADSPDAWYSKGKCLEHLGDPIQALKCYNNALANQDDPEKRHDIVEALERL